MEIKINNLDLPARFFLLPFTFFPKSLISMITPVIPGTGWACGLDQAPNIGKYR